MNFCNYRQLSLVCTEGYQDFGCWSFMLANTSRGLGAQLMSDSQRVSMLWFIDRMLGSLSNTGRYWEETFELYLHRMKPGARKRIVLQGSWGSIVVLFAKLKVVLGG